jgi:hypothetical protein
MNEDLQAQLGALVNAVRTALLPDDCKHSAAWCLGQLPRLYAQLRQTSDSRYHAEINRLVQGALKALATNTRAYPEGQTLATSIISQLRHVHEQLGIPVLNLKPLCKSPRRSRKVS